jgi:aerobic-type carbon monoxide dehydrogenase small subunit (CoxS/CutS family)
MTHELIVNGTPQSWSENDEDVLLWYLRDGLGISGARFGCGIGICGCCTVLIGGKATHSCTARASMLAGAEISTLEGLAHKSADGTEVLHPVQQAFLENPLQCGWCLPGHIMSAVELLQQHASPSPEQLEASASRNLCRCGGYGTIRKAFARAVQLRREAPQ